jgi:Flp pilus assembly CpaE family ATPase
VLDQSRHLYDWVLLDLPSIFHPVSLTALVECESAFLVSTAELPSLHLARKAVTLLAQLGIGKERLKVLVNQVGRGDGMSGSDLEKIFGCAVHSCFPNDYSSLHKVVALGEPLAPQSTLGRAVGEFAGRVAGLARSEKGRAGIVLSSDPAFAGT